jgi:hypothetical protein
MYDKLVNSSIVIFLSILIVKSDLKQQFWLKTVPGGQILKGKELLIDLSLIQDTGDTKLS